MRRTLDKPRVAGGMRTPGIDPRLWVAYGVVGTPREDGTVDTTDYHAIHIGPGGCTVDVVLQPENIPVVCHYNGIAGGRSGWIDVPIHPGDKVVVGLPGGDTSYPVILGFRNNLSQQIPCEAEDGKPVFRNDRVSIYASGVPIEIRTAGGARLRLNQDGTIQLGQDASQQLVLGTDYRGAEQGWHGALDVFLEAMASSFNGVTDPASAVGALHAVGATVKALREALSQFESSDYLSQKTRTT